MPTEYRTIYWAHVPNNYQKMTEDITATLNEFGANGWEVVSHSIGSLTGSDLRAGTHQVYTYTTHITTSVIVKRSY